MPRRGLTGFGVVAVDMVGCNLPHVLHLLLLLLRLRQDYLGVAATLESSSSGALPSAREQPSSLQAQERTARNTPPPQAWGDANANTQAWGDATTNQPLAWGDAQGATQANCGKLPPWRNL